MRRARASNKTGRGRKFSRALRVGSLFGRLSYLHPTKGWRFRQSPIAALMERV